MEASVNPTPESAPVAPESAQEPVSAVPTSEPTPTPIPDPTEALTAPTENVEVRPAEPTTAKPAVPVVPDESKKLRSDADALVGEFVKVVDGEHKGKIGALQGVAVHDEKTGYPKSVFVRTRDAANELIHVLYDHVRPHRSYKGGR